MKKGFIQHRQNGAGFTLVEVVIVMALFSGLMIVGTTMFFQVVMSANRATTEVELRQNLSLAMDVLARNIRRAVSFTVADNYHLNLYSDVDKSQLLTSFAISGTPPNAPVVQDGTKTITSAKIYVDQVVSRFETDGTTAVKITLKLNVANASRSDYSTTQIATQSVSLRQISF